jgi:hypothetical protein
MASNDLIAVTSLIGKVLSANTLTTSSVDQLAPAANHGMIVKKAIACNTTASAATLTITVTKSGGSALTIVSAYPVAAGDTVDFTELAGLCLGPSDKVSALAGTGASINLIISGTENS